MNKISHNEYWVPCHLTIELFKPHNIFGVAFVEYIKVLLTKQLDQKGHSLC